MRRNGYSFAIGFILVGAILLGSLVLTAIIVIPAWLFGGLF